MIRHKATKELMPQMKRGKGYSHWNPTVDKFPDRATKVPRLLSSKNAAIRCIAQWNANPNSRWSSHQSYEGDWDEFVDCKPDGRKKEDLEIVKVRIKEIK